MIVTVRRPSGRAPRMRLGIDFGTTNSLASVWGSDVTRILEGQGAPARPVVFWHKDGTLGNRPHPSVVWFKPDDSVTERSNIG